MVWGHNYSRPKGVHNPVLFQSHPFNTFFLFFILFLADRLASFVLLGLYFRIPCGFLQNSLGPSGIFITGLILTSGGYLAIWLSLFEPDLIYGNFTALAATFFIIGMCFNFSYFMAINFVLKMISIINDDTLCPGGTIPDSSKDI